MMAREVTLYRRYDVALISELHAGVVLEQQTGAFRFLVRGDLGEQAWVDARNLTLSHGRHPNSCHCCRCAGDDDGPTIQCVEEDGEGNVLDRAPSPVPLQPPKKPMTVSERLEDDTPGFGIDSPAAARQKAGEHRKDGPTSLLPQEESPPFGTECVRVTFDLVDAREEGPGRYWLEAGTPDGNRDFPAMSKAIEWLTAPEEPTMVLTAHEVWTLAVVIGMEPYNHRQDRPRIDAFVVKVENFMASLR